MNKKVISVLLILAVILVGVFSGCKNNKEAVSSGEKQVQIISEWQDIFGDDSMVNKTDYIITGKVTDKKVREIIAAEDYSTMLFSFYTIEINKSISGGLKEKEKIKVMIRGDGENLISEGIEQTGGYMKKGDNVLLFLNNPDEFSRNFYEEVYKEKMNYYFLKTSLQGRIWLDDNGEFDKNMQEYNSKCLENIKSIEDIENMLKK